MNNNLKLSFSLSEQADFSFRDSDGKETLSCKTEGGVLTCQVHYDFNEKPPLKLTAKAELNDRVEIILLPYRIELWINSVLKDEEWPAGDRLFDVCDTLDSKLQIQVEEYTLPVRSLPSVIGEFENAEGWQPEENVFVGDCMPYVCEDRFHVLYLKDRHHHMSKWSLGAHQWEHISTADFKSWQIHPMAIETDNPVEGSICTGSFIKNADKYYLFYTVRMADGAPAPIKRCVSDDGYHFSKDKSFSMVLSEKYNLHSARDPKVVLDKDGIFHMFLTTSIGEYGCLAHLVSKDLNEWEECATPIYTHTDKSQPECPDYIEYNGYYYLIYSINGKAHYMYSKEPFGNWIIPDDPIIPCSTVPKGAVWDDKIVFIGFIKRGGYAGGMTFKTAQNNSDGILIF
ncbi:MAG: hypothetical protein UHN02_08250 [Acutalibacteraceae bacterium]|nr:hypothetical protein [Acutalibacteraceae bacterium]